MELADNSTKNWRYHSNKQGSKDISCQWEMDSKTNHVPVEGFGWQLSGRELAQYTQNPGFDPQHGKKKTKKMFLFKKKKIHPG